MNAKGIKCTKLGEIGKGQDGAIFGDYIFHFDATGRGCVYHLEGLEALAEFQLDKSDLIVPHSNAVSFGCEYYKDGDEFPLLYTNIYNNYGAKEDKMEGACCVYRIIRNGTNFSSQLVQFIRVGFANDNELWRSKSVEDIRPFGNLVVDCEKQKLFAFVMRDEERKTRFFEFNLPKFSDGEYDEKLGVNTVVLQKNDICRMFDGSYMHLMQGACMHNGYIYSVEGDTGGVDRTPAIRIFDARRGEAVFETELVQYGLNIEPEFIDIYNDTVYYADGSGAFYTFIIE